MTYTHAVKTHQTPPALSIFHTPLNIYFLWEYRTSGYETRSLVDFGVLGIQMVRGHGGGTMTSWSGLRNQRSPLHDDRMATSRPRLIRYISTQVSCIALVHARPPQISHILNRFHCIPNGSWRPGVSKLARDSGTFSWVRTALS